MESARVSQNAELNSVPIDCPPTASSKAEGLFCGWCIKVCNCISYLKSLHEWIKQTLHTWLAKRSYSNTLKAYNASYVMEKTAEEANTLAQGIFGKIERYKVTMEDPDATERKTRIPVCSTNDNECEDPVDHYTVPVLHAQEIAYKTADASLALDNEFNVVRGEMDAKSEAKYLLDQEKKALAALDHPNIIKPVIVEGNVWQKKTMTVIEVGSLSDQEKQELTAMVAESGYTPSEDDGGQIDFDFEVVESVETTEPSGIPLPLADSTLKAGMASESLSTIEKDNVARAMIHAVAHAHQRGYAHLDINPSNILEKDDNWLLCDWGCTHHYSEMRQGSMDFMPVCSGSYKFFFGTLGYLSPQMHARSSIAGEDDYVCTVLESIISGTGKFPHFETDARAADAYSLGIVLFEMLTGVNPTPTDTEGKSLSDIGIYFQENVDRLLQEHKESLGEYYDIVSSLLQSTCSSRMTVIAAERKLSQIPMPQ